MSTKQDVDRLPLAVRWIPLEEPREPIRTQLLADVLPPVAMRRQRFSHTFSHSLCTSLSASCLQVIKVSIQPSSVGMVAGSVDGIDDRCVGSGIFTSSMLVSIVAAGKRYKCYAGESACREVVVRGVVVALNLADDVRISQKGRTLAEEGV